MDEKETRYVPYLSVAKLDRVMELVQTRTMSRVNTALFSGYGFNNTDAPLAVRLLKFLGAIDEEGNATNVMAQLQMQSEEKRKLAFETVIRTSYNILFNAVKDAHKLTADELTDEFRVQYKQSTRIAGSAVPVFLRLCEMAGLIEKGAVVTRKREPTVNRPNASKLKTSSKETEAKARAGRVLQEFTGDDFYIHPIVKGKMSITIPDALHLRSATDDALNDAWRDLLKMAHKFAQKYLSDARQNESLINEAGEHS